MKRTASPDLIGRRDKFFTLIELLVVIAIIAILAGMLLPALGQAREKGRSIACLNNISSVGSAIKFYTDDNREFLPCIYGKRVLLSCLKDERLIAPYLNCSEQENMIGYINSNYNPQSPRSRFACPSENRNNSATIAYSIPVFNPAWYGKFSAPFSYTMSRFRRPSRTMILAEAGFNNGVKGITYRCTPGKEAESYAYRHNNRMNVIFADGHGAALSCNQVPHNSNTQPGYFAQAWQCIFWELESNIGCDMY